jgi:glycosyltransferase involved in cell wall biosynthesis
MQLGGMERMIAALALATDRERFDVEVLCLKAVGEVGDTLSGKGIVVRDAGFGQSKPSYFPFFRLARAIREARPDVVHTHNTSALLSGAASAWLAGVRNLIHTEHGRSFPDKLKYMVAERLASSVVKHVVGVSQSVVHDLQRYVRIPATKLRVIVNGVAPIPRAVDSRLLELRSDLGIAADALVVGTAGRLVWEKGLKYLLEAWPSVICAEPTSRLLIVGDGALRTELQSLAVELGIAGSVLFVGQRKDVGTLMQTMDVFAIPSISEGLPLVLLEAMSLGSVIVATSVGGIPDALGHGRGGTIVPPSDAPAMANALLNALNDSSAARARARVAAMLFTQRFTASSMARAYEQLYLGKATRNEQSA